MMSNLPLFEVDLPAVPEPFVLRDYQLRALEALRQTVGQGVKRVVLMAPTGAGKTMLAAAMAQGALAKGNGLAFVVPMLNLIDQARGMFIAAGIDATAIGVMQQDHVETDWSRPIQICSIATLRSRRVIPDAATAVFDECHVLSKSHIEWLSDPAWARRPIIGLSATPWSRGLGKHFDTLHVVATTKEMIEQGVLSPFRVFSVSAPDLSRVKVTAGDYQKDQLSEVMRRLTADIVKTWQRLWGRDRTLCFAVDLAHARQLQARFAGAGISCGYQDGGTPAVERAELRRRFQSGETRVVVSVGTMTTGVDLDVRCISMAQPTKSEIKLVQILGRGLRTAPGKDSCLILDHTTNTERLGFVTDIHYDYLDSGEKNSKGKDRKRLVPKPCEACGYIPPMRERKCGNCGFERPLPVSGLVEHDGALVEVTGGRARGQKHLIEFTVAEKKAFYAQLMWLGAQRRYKSGWAAVQFKERFGSWPPRNWNWGVRAVEAGPLVLSWVQHRMIAYAKARAKKGRV